MPIEDNLESTKKHRETEKKFHYSKATIVNIWQVFFWSFSFIFYEFIFSKWLRTHYMCSYLLPFLLNLLIYVRVYICIKLQLSFITCISCSASPRSVDPKGSDHFHWDL